MTNRFSMSASMSERPRSKRGSWMMPGILVSAVTVPTEPNRGAAHGLARMCEAVRAAAETAGAELHRITAIGVAAPGLLDIPAGVILEAANLPGWRDVQASPAHRRRVWSSHGFSERRQRGGLRRILGGAGRGARSLLLLTLAQESAAASSSTTAFSKAPTVTAARSATSSSR